MQLSAISGNLLKMGRENGIELTSLRILDEPKFGIVTRMSVKGLKFDAILTPADKSCFDLPIHGVVIFERGVVSDKSKG